MFCYGSFVWGVFVCVFANITDIRQRTDTKEGQNSQAKEGQFGEMTIKLMTITRLGMRT